MDQRYEIHEQLGKGGIGAVYRAYDRHLKREVAIKRILAQADAEDREAARKHLTEEASTLCALQHPNIVTLFDIGFDEDSPFVVMELLTGRTLEELVEQAPLTWDDFHQLALQTQEALIAAQERHLIHRDIKPSNVMLTWLPSGKFQVKLVDFGLAKFSPQPTLQEIGRNDSVLGSIFFMAPEQFERIPLDGRTDMYAMGCVYYYALSSEYPFTGTTGQEVMIAHLEHRVQPLHERRPDIPRWAADWVMWHMNHNPDARPADAREALKQFIMNDESSTQPPQPNEATEPAPATPHHPRLIIPDTQPVPQQDQPDQQPTPAIPVHPVHPVQPAAPVHAVQPIQTAQPLAPVPAQPAAPVQQPSPKPAPPRPEPHPTTPQPLQPPAGSKPSVHDAARKATTAVVAVQAPSTTAVPLTLATRQSTPPPADQGVGVQAPPPGTMVGAPEPKKKKKLSNGAMITIAAVLGLMVVLFGCLMLSRMKENKRAKIYNALVVQAKEPDIKEISVNKEQLGILLDSASSNTAQAQRQTIYQCLLLAKSTDGTNVDKEIAERAANSLMASAIRINFFKVLERRANPEAIPILLSFASKSDKINEAAAALEACKKMARDEDFDQFLGLLESTGNLNVQRAAESTISKIIDRSKNRGKLTSMLASAYDRQIDEDRRLVILRLLGHAGGDQAVDIVEKDLGSENVKEQIAAIGAIGSWPDDSMFETLMDFLSDCEDPILRRRAFDTGRRFLSNAKRKRDSDDSEELWKMLARNAKTDGEQVAIIDGVARQKGDWVISVVEYFADNADNDKVIDRAEKALDFIRDREQIKNKDKDEE